jgi:hypothetical protein
MLICIVMGSNHGGIFILYTRQEIYHALYSSDRQTVRRCYDPQ